ncbi:MAG: type II toxin-antitoxin system VapC family toxin [candidate division NC10 bacterium]|nr:type II toxin-antitoxin system VapC family toxin [candidate division NC10 bacterium]MDE2321704.1 type II toxin-antitoxin system VapC family toxin [candidate division NC10 bacterium]
MAVPVSGKVILDTNIFVDYLRDELYADWVFGRVGDIIRFLSSVVLMELRLGANTPRRNRAVDRIKAAFPAGRLIAPAPQLFDHAGQLFRILYGDGSGLRDRLGAIDDLLIALTARQIGATVITNNVGEFRRIAGRLPGLAIAAPDSG